ncbi:MAG: UDP binding domain-containing protein, partial [Planctomycetota bacterium]
MPHYVIDRLAEALNRQGKAVKGSRVLVVGLAYKADIDDVRESPSFELIELLRARGAEVDYHDPLVPATRAGRKHDLRMASVQCDASSIARYDCVLISTAHSTIDYATIARASKLVVDTRDAMRAHEKEMGDRLVRA